MHAPMGGFHTPPPTTLLTTGSAMALAAILGAAVLQPHRAAPLFAPALAPRPIFCCDAPPSEDNGPPSSLPRREIDSRGFVVPQVGDIVRMPSKWPGEYDVGQVDFVTFVASRSSYEVDLMPLKPIGQSMYCLPGGRKPAAVRADIAKLSRLETEYVKEKDAYVVDETQLIPLGGKPKERPDVTAEYLAEYAELKVGLLREAALVGAAGALLAYPLLGAEIASSFGAGSLAGLAYVFLLQQETNSVGGEPLPKALAIAAQGRLALPLVLMSSLVAAKAASGGQVAMFSLLSKEQFGAAALGFLSYKAPLLVRQVLKAIEELGKEDAQAPIEAGALSGGSLSVAFKLAQQNLKKEKSAPEARARKIPQQVVLCGPSGVGKSTLIAQLLSEFPDRYGFSVSVTTRQRRADEQEGEDYYFVSEEVFEQMVAEAKFVEWATVGGHKYGTSIAGVEEVSASGRLCLLDLDVQGVQSVIKLGQLSPFCVWVAPPSLESLRTRLEQRGTEDGDEINRRLKRARDEIEFSLTARCFDKIVINDRLEEAYTDLKEALAFEAR